MPTGYTAELMDKGQDFRTFVLTCARAMGATIMQRDSPMSEPPKLQEPTDWHAKRIAEATALLKRLNAMSNEQRLAFGDNARAEEIKRLREGLAKDAAANQRLDAMAERVSAWNPPTPDHQGLKTFMLEQISISRNSDYYSTRLRDCGQKSAMVYFAEAILGAERDIAYNTEEQAKEVARTNERNGWITNLYASLK